MALAACSPNLLVVEAIRDFGGFHADLLRRPLVWRDGFVEIPEAPGLGVELDEDVARAHAFTGDGLHLDMAQVPIDEADPGPDHRAPRAPVATETQQRADTRPYFE